MYHHQETLIANATIRRVHFARFDTLHLQAGNIAQVYCQSSIKRNRDTVSEYHDGIPDPFQASVNLLQFLPNSESSKSETPYDLTGRS